MAQTHAVDYREAFVLNVGLRTWEIIGVVANKCLVFLRLRLTSIFSFLQHSFI